MLVDLVSIHKGEKGERREGGNGISGMWKAGMYARVHGLGGTGVVGSGIGGKVRGWGVDAWWWRRRRRRRRRE